MYKKIIFYAFLIFSLNLFPTDAFAEATPQQAKGQSESISFIEHIQNITERLELRYEEMRESFKQFEPNTNRIYSNLTDLQGWPRMVYGIQVLFGLGILGYIISFLVSYPLYRKHRQSRPEKFIYFSNRFLFHFVYLIINSFEIILFTLIIFGGSLLFFDRFDPMRLFVKTMLLLFIIIWASAYFFKFIHKLSSNSKDSLLKSPLFIDLLLIIGLVSFAANMSGFLKILGLLEDLQIVWNISTGFLVIIVGSIAFLRHKTEIIQAYLGIDNSTETHNQNFNRRQFITSIFPSLTILYLLAVWSIWSLNLFLKQSTPAYFAFVSVIAFSLIPFINKAIEKIVLIARESIEENMVNIVHAIQLVFSWLLTLLFVAAFLEGLNLPALQFFFSPKGQIVSISLFTIALTIAASYGLWFITKRSIQNYLDKEQAKLLAEGKEGEISVGEDGRPIIVKTRAETLLPLFQVTILILILSISIMVILSAIGVDIGPLLAGAGVVGLAIGFGAQALVKDIVSGIFFLVDDAFRIGEYVEIDDDIRGEVEKISLRSMQLRHHKGAIHTIPFGELRSITNYNRDWAIYKQEFRVPYDADIEKIRKIIKKIGKKLMQDEELGPKFIQQLKSQGVKRMEDSAMILGTKFMCKPREQFYLRRVIFQKIQEAFANEGIEFARKQVQVALPEEHLDDEYIIGAASDLEDEVPPPKNPKR